MTEKEINIAIAERCGWTRTKEPIYREDEFGDFHSESDWWYRYRKPTTQHEFCLEKDHVGYPNYFSSLDNMHEAEKILLLREEDWSRYCDILMDIVITRGGGYQAAELFVHADAGKRAEAFLKTLNLWRLALSS